MGFLSQHFSELLSFLAGLFAGGLSVHFASNRQSGSSKRQDFRRASAGGDIVGGNKTEK
jgi:hypothetical protein